MIFKNKGHLLPHGFFIRQLEGLTYTFRIFRPYMLTDQIRRLISLKHFRGFFIYKYVVPVFIQYDEPVVHMLDDVEELFRRKRSDTFSFGFSPIVLPAEFRFHTFAPQILWN